MAAILRRSSCTCRRAAPRPGTLAASSRFEPYVGNGERGTRNANDGIFGQGGDQLTLALAGSPQTGYTTTFEIGVDVG